VGQIYANVFPLPVFANPKTSLPDKAAGTALKRTFFNKNLKNFFGNF